MRARRTWVQAAAVAAAVLVVGGCGSDGQVDGPGDAARPAAEWTTQAIDGEIGADRELQLATWGDEVMVVGVTDQDELWSASGRVGTELTPTEPLATDITYLSLGGTARLGNRWLTLGSGGLEEVDGDGELRFEPHAYRSDDGRTWEPLEVTGFSGPIEVQELIARGDRWVAVGNARSAEDPAMGGFEARAWWSTDGEAWTEVELPAGSGESVATDIVEVGDRLLAVGHDGEDGALWSSSDGGATWATVADPALAGLGGVRSIAADGDTILLSGSPRDDGENVTEETAPQVLLRSDDGGSSWAPAADPPPTEGAEPWLPIFGGGGGRFLATTSDFLEGWQDPEACYADIDRCRMDSVAAMYASDGGDRWDRIDTSGLGDGEAGEVQTMTTADDGTVLAITWDDGLRLSTWPAGVELPTTDEPAQPEAEVAVLAEGEEPDVGVRYAAPLFIHCGMDWLYLGGEPWQRTDDGPDVETGAGDPSDPDWPIAQQTIFGFATLTDEGTIEYSIGPDDAPEVIATYERTGVQPPGCD